MSKLFENELERRIQERASEAYHSLQGRIYRKEYERLLKVAIEFWERHGISLSNSEQRYQVMFAMDVLQRERNRVRAMNAAF